MIIANKNIPHTPVLIEEVIQTLKVKNDLTYVDATFGFGGISERILEKSNCKLIAIDKDPDVLSYTKRFLLKHRERFKFALGNFGSLSEILKKLNIDQIDGGIVADLGVSSMQLDNPKRGFSFKKDGPLDMRMNREGITAEEIINSFSEQDLSEIIWKYGEERLSRRIARLIVRERDKKKISTTKQLVAIIEKITSYNNYKKTHPATRTFQALRIFLNNELDEIKKLISESAKILLPGAKLIIITFHSLEDRIVKKFFNDLCGKYNNNNRHLPENLKRRKAEFINISKKIVTPKKSEIYSNRRARSAKLRAIERIGTAL